jgi:diguanylate cyclase (GGDEF)-like protein
VPTHKLRPLWRQFAEPEIERAFQRYAAPLHKAAFQRMLLAGALLYVLCFVNDVILLGWHTSDATDEKLALLFALRLVCAAVSMATWYYIRPARRSPRKIARVATLTNLASLAVLIVVMGLVPQEGLAMVMLLVMISVISYLFVPAHPLTIAITNSACSLVFLLVAQIAQSWSGGQLAVLAVILVAVNGFGFALARDLHLSWRREFRSHLALEQAAIRDHLTHSYNRRHLSETLMPKEIERARRYRTWLSLIVCDLDHFKAINDAHGHPSGDAALRACADVLHQGTRRNVDSVVRLGGEEFLIVMPNTDLTSAADMAERLRKALAATAVTSLAGQPIVLTASFGVSGVNYAERDADENRLIEAADQYLYEAKDAGRNTVKSGPVI